METLRKNQEEMLEHSNRNEMSLMDSSENWTWPRKELVHLKIGWNMPTWNVKKKKTELWANMKRCNIYIILIPEQSNPLIQEAERRINISPCSPSPPKKNPQKASENKHAYIYIQAYHIQTSENKNKLDIETQTNWM